MGWNVVTPTRENPLSKNLPDEARFYFVHSYYVETASEDDCVATTDYGLDYTSIAGSGRVFGVQFHPEKSQAHGLCLLDNFAHLN